ncbi:unnamed protein product [Penicillium pancosmium]
MSDKTGPAWGRLAIEQYFMLNWDPSSTETPDQQRCRLVTEFLNINIIPLDLFHIPERLPVHTSFGSLRLPTTEEIDIILRPYRSEELRWHAMNAYTDEICPHLLRTYYSAEGQRAKDDAQMEKWIDSETFCEEAEWAVLDNENIFNFGPGPEDWRRIYDILPELAGPLSTENFLPCNGKISVKRCLQPNDFKEMHSYFRRDLASMQKEDPEAWRRGPNSVIESAGMGLQRMASSTYILIADEEAFQSGSLLVLYLDGFRRVVRGGRIKEEHDIANIVGIWMCTADLMEHSAVSERYRVDGDLGRELYQLNEELLGDP